MYAFSRLRIASTTRTIDNLAHSSISDLDLVDAVHRDVKLARLESLPVSTTQLWSEAKTI